MSVLSNENPVLRAELKHQQHVINTSRAGRVWILVALALLAPAFIVSLAHIIEAFTGLDLIGPAVPGQATVGNLSFGLLVTMNLALYLVVTLITMGLAASSIHREQEGRTWESLLLTTLDPRAIIYGKWWATLRALWGDHLMVGWLRLGLVAWLAVSLASFQQSPDARPDVPLLLLAFAIITAFTVVDAGFSAALGLLSPLLAPGNSLLIGVLVARLIVSVLIVVGCVLMANLFAPSLWAALLSTLIVLGLLALLTWGTLGLAQRLATPRRRASP